MKLLRRYVYSLVEGTVSNLEAHRIKKIVDHYAKTGEFPNFETHEVYHMAKVLKDADLWEELFPVFSKMVGKWLSDSIKHDFSEYNEFEQKMLDAVRDLKKRQDEESRQFSNVTVLRQYSRGINSIEALALEAAAFRYGTSDLPKKIQLATIEWMLQHIDEILELAIVFSAQWDELVSSGASPKGASPNKGLRAARYRQDDWHTYVGFLQEFKANFTK